MYICMYAAPRAATVHHLTCPCQQLSTMVSSVMDSVSGAESRELGSGSIRPIWTSGSYTRI